MPAPGDLCVTRGVVARKTPHLLLAKSPEFSSPLGEGEEARPFEEIETGRPSFGSCKGLIWQERRTAPPR